MPKGDSFLNLSHKINEQKKNKEENSIIKILAVFWIRSLRYLWSALRHRNSLQEIAAEKLKVYLGYVPETISDISKTMHELYNRFEWTQDNYTHLFDSLDSPASCWDRAFSNPPLMDDCDGFHGALYWAVSHHFTCRLLTVVTDNIKESHTVLVIFYNNQVYLANYIYLSQRKSSIDEILLELLTTHYKSFDNIKIVAWELSQWNGRRWVTSPR